MMWTQSPPWKHALVWPALILAGVFLHDRELSPVWFAGLGIALFLALAYLAREMVWMTRRQGRPCGHCGQNVPMKSFHVQANCPHCGLELE
ncbi:hypothetical protein [Prosthecobacter sp.]|jgi:hypothetical protein|uniref:hypothetical protein n=1 Tax=Prosthecobacter sp. TaxID=1965333 RepID=UPI0037844393